jgi:fructosamine-3-kinase
MITVEALWQRHHGLGMARAQTLDWQGVAQEWTARWEQLFAERPVDDRVRRKVLRAQGDHEALAAWEG